MVQWLRVYLSVQGTRVHSLVWELGSQMLRGVAKKKKKKKKSRTAVGMGNMWDTGKRTVVEARSNDDLWARQLGNMDEEQHR